MARGLDRVANNNIAGAWSCGVYRCLACGFERNDVAPVGWEFSYCPECGVMKYTTKYVFRKEDTVYVCACGCDVFSITPSRLFCPNCGRDHRPFDDDGE